MELSIISFTFTVRKNKSIILEELDNKITPEEQIEEIFFTDFADCVISDITYEELSEQIFKDNKNEILSFLMICFKNKIRCYEAAELLINISKNLLK